MRIDECGRIIRNEGESIQSFTIDECGRIHRDKGGQADKEEKFHTPKPTERGAFSHVDECGRLVFEDRGIEN